jgi:carbonic anhydrase/acetyltransferase-like protein (isoleucine patch superfamily)
VSLNRAPDPTVRIADSAVLVGEVWLGAGVYLAQGLVVHSVDGGVRIGNHSAVLENGTVWGTPEHPTVIGRRTVFGHRSTVLGATVGDLCEIGNGAILLPGSRLGDGCILGEGTLVPADTVVPPHTVLVGRPPHALRSATPADRERLAALRDHQTDLTDDPHQLVAARPDVGADMGRLYGYLGRQPVIDPTAVLFDSAEITGDVTVGPRSVIGAGVKIIGDSHGPVRIGADVQILANTVLHLLPDNELVVEDDCVIGPGAMIHGCHIGAGSVVEAAAIVCDWSHVGPGSLVTAGSCVTQRSRFEGGAVLSGFPATQTGTLDGPPARPAWAFTAEGLATIVALPRQH